ncbi:MAG: hypothetical protein J2P31_21115 [Blastocatellia bacterium]|nr:hypothetical protein [Blastocatellia bacterium]
MTRRRLVVAVSMAIFTFPFLAYGIAAYSDRTGIYARIDKVILEPAANAPERIQIWGAFVLARKDDRNLYDSAQHGYLYFSCKPGKHDVCRKEWADLKKIAGSGEVVGFGGRDLPRPRIRKAEERATDPDEYPLNFGLVKMSDRDTNYPPIVELKSLPREHN